MISRFCIQRPIFAVVLSAVIVIAGLGAMMRLPVAQYPDIAPPVVTVSAAYPGADADTIAQAVAAPIETQVNGVDNMYTWSLPALRRASIRFQLPSKLVPIRIQRRFRCRTE